MGASRIAISQEGDDDGLYQDDNEESDKKLYEFGFFRSNIICKQIKGRVRETDKA